MAGSLPTSKVRCSTPDNAEEPYRRVFRKRRSSARLWEQLREYFEVRFRAEKYGLPSFLAESEAKQSDPRKETVGARARHAVEDLNGGHRHAALHPCTGTAER